MDCCLFIVMSTCLSYIHTSLVQSRTRVSLGVINYIQTLLASIMFGQKLEKEGDEVHNYS